MKKTFATTLHDKNYYINRKNRLNLLLEKNADGIYINNKKNQYWQNKGAKSNNDFIDDQTLIMMLLSVYPDVFECIEDIKLIEQYWQNHYNKSTRLKHRIEKLLTSGKAIFGTLTFNDLTLNTTNSDKRRLMVVRYLKSQGIEYVANIDYGKKKEREHYHFIANNKVDCKKWFDLGYGTCNVIKIRSNSIPLKLAHYLNKLVNHALKKTTKNQKIIYSR